MEARVVFTCVFFLFAAHLYVSGSSIAQRREEQGGKKEEKVNYKRQFVFYPNEGEYGHHHHHHHHEHEGFFDAGHAGEVLDDGYQDHGNLEEMQMPHFEHVHHQFKHIHHVGEFTICYDTGSACNMFIISIVHTWYTYLTDMLHASLFFFSLRFYSNLN